MKTSKYLATDMTRKDLSYFIKRDFERKQRWKGWCSPHFMFSALWDESFAFTLWFRIGSYLSSKKNYFSKVLLLFVKIIYKHIQHSTGIQIPFGTHIGPGLRFFHYGTIIMAFDTILGENSSIHQGVTIGRVFAGPYAGTPTIGDNVVVFAGAKILGAVHVGDNAVIGANAVVTRDVPDNCVVAGVPAKVITTDSSHCFNKKWGDAFQHGYIDE